MILRTSYIHLHVQLIMVSRRPPVGFHISYIRRLLPQTYLHVGIWDIHANNQPVDTSMYQPYLSHLRKVIDRSIDQILILPKIPRSPPSASTLPPLLLLTKPSNESRWNGGGGWYLVSSLGKKQNCLNSSSYPPVQQMCLLKINVFSQRKSKSTVKT